MTPEQLLYAKTHEWVAVEADPSGAKIATVGLSAFALENLTDLVHLQVFDVGVPVQAGEPLGEIESVKSVSDLYSPVDGEIVEVNATWAPREGETLHPTRKEPVKVRAGEQLDDLAKDPYGAGWLVKIKIADESALAELLDYAGYQTQCEEGMADE
jgi:glycine cleavage system H protein